MGWYIIILFILLILPKVYKKLNIKLAEFNHDESIRIGYELLITVSQGKAIHSSISVRQNQIFFNINCVAGLRH